MANKAAVTFYLLVQGDGVSTTFMSDCATDPYGFIPPAGSIIGPGFNAGSAALTGTADLSCSGGQSVTAASTGSIITYTLSAPIAANTFEYITGKLVF